ncbi:reverse transcriptase domain-containing protein, partial [Tanacetum coccineum]
MTQAAIKKLVADSVVVALEAQACLTCKCRYIPIGTPDKELAVLCPTMVPNNEKLIKVFNGGLPRSIEGNVTTSKPQTLEEATTIAQRLMDQNRRQETVRAYAATPTEDNRNKGTATRSNLQPGSVPCHAYGEKGHYKNQCPKANNSARSRAYVLGNKNAHQNSNVVT